MTLFRRSLVLAFFTTAPIGAVQAQTVADFYRGKSIEVVIGSSAGGGYDLYARMLARHMSKYIPGNPKLVPKNMEGASGMRLANWLNQVAPRDGTVFGATSRAFAFEPMLGNKAAQYDAGKITWIGSANDEVSVCMAWHTSGVARFEDVQGKELMVGTSGVADDTYQFPSLLNNMFGAKFKMITGYPGGNDINLGLERGEVHGRCGIPWSTLKATRPQWLAEKQVNLLMQFSLAKHKELPNVLLVTDLAKSDEQRLILRLIFGRQVMGRPFAAPPDVPKDRADALRKAFMDTMNDRDFLAEVEKAKVEVTPVSGDTLNQMVQDIYASTPPSVAAKAATMIK